ncbi:hypothetical protein BH10ACT11_BH10ACT11_04580 [soil metagenome]
MEEAEALSAPARLRQAVFAARDLETAVAGLREQYELAEPFSDPAVAHFGLQNAVFAIGDTFLEVVSPVEEGTAAGRLLDRRGGDCGYMAMFQVEDVAAARKRAADAEVREVFQIELDDIVEAHLHPADIGNAIVSVSQPKPAASWRWGGPDWQRRQAPGSIVGITVACADAARTKARWSNVVGELSGVSFVADGEDRGIVSVEVERDGEIQRVRLSATE